MEKEAKKPGAVLRAKMDEYQASARSLSKAIGASQSGVNQIVGGRTKITVSMALRLGKFFGTTPLYWLDLQRDFDLAEALKDKKLAATVKGIAKATKPAVKAKAKAKPAAAKAKPAARKAPGAKPAVRKPRKAK
ncbi:hypothetical protein AGMMS49928_14280 [Spirochaetia bacterium]|nr:hypothetical protein AGMMS49928_14280 [Spirochaetia bacterium]